MFDLRDLMANDVVSDNKHTNNNKIILICSIFQLIW